MNVFFGEMGFSRFVLRTSSYTFYENRFFYCPPSVKIVRHINQRRKTRSFSIVSFITCSTEAIMPCLIITGYPSAGKTKVSRMLKKRALLRPEIDNVILLNEESACPDHTKNECYVSTGNEKQTRAALKSVFD